MLCTMQSLLVDDSSEIFSDYFRLRILQCITDWENLIKQHYLVCYSV